MRLCRAFCRAQLLVLAALLLSAPRSHALGQDPYVESAPSRGCFTLVRDNAAASILVDAADHAGVRRAAGDLRADLARVTGCDAPVTSDDTAPGTNVIIVGTLGKSRVVDRLFREGRLEAAPLAGQWESFLIQVVTNPLPGVARGLVIAGSDKRGTIYGLYDLSEQIGVSPWHWWADVPARRRDALYVRAGAHRQGPPAVKYRGIFLNDEGPCLMTWARERYGELNHGMYTNVFELLLRLKANYLWPAMWDNSFATDDPLNARLADEYGIVMGTSHHEPMMRAWKEWERAGHEKGSWDYSKNAGTLRAFWAEGLRRTKDYEKIITLAMRGDGDEPMSETESIALLEKIVADQRQMIAATLNPNVTEVPQLWALYKEVQGYYEQGMRVPDDVTLLWCDDNWGHLRRLPTEDERRRAGGAGVYYHFDYVGGPRNYKWLNTTPITKVWEQMNLAYQHGADRIWIVNVGDLKPMEFPIEFFLTLAWNPARWPRDSLMEYTRLWALREFGPAHAAEIAEIVAQYPKFNGRRKPELLEPDTFILVNYQEADTVLADWNALAESAERISRALPANARDAFFQLVLHPAKACAIVNELYVAAGRNRLYAGQGRARANDQAARVRRLFAEDAALSDYYNRTLAGGKWNHMMDQTHIGYTDWQQPPSNAMPAVVELQIPEAGQMGVAVEGSTNAWPGASGEPALPVFDVFNQPVRRVEIFNRGRTPFEFTATAGAPWIVLSQTRGRIEKELELRVEVDWTKAPKGTTRGFVTITGAGAEPVRVRVEAFYPEAPARETLNGFVEADGHVSLEAEHFTAQKATASARWEKLPDHGRTRSAMTIFPVTANSVMPPLDSPCLEYQLHLFRTGRVELEAILSPALNTSPDRGVRLGFSFDDQPPQVVTVVPKGYFVDNGVLDWEESVKDSVRKVKSVLTLDRPGPHTLKVWMVDPGVVLQKLVLDTGGVRPSYLGPPESFRGQPGAAVTGRHRNLFAEAGHSLAEVKAKINGAFQQLFYGDPATQAVYFPAGTNANGPLAFIADIHNRDVRSEGMSYGMMIAVQLDRKAEFDALWNWARTFMCHDTTNHPARGFFSWSVRTNGVANDEMPAPDGEEYFATALYFAAGRWANGAGIYDYRAEADRLLTDLRHRPLITGPTASRTMAAGDLFHPGYAMVRFTPDLANCDHTDPSYHLPAFYELWARWGPESDRQFWSQAAAASREFFHRAAHPVTGLTPDYAEFDGRPWAAPWKPDSVDYRSDSWRTVMNWSVDWAWWAADAGAPERSDRLLAFFEADGFPAYAGQYTLAGKRLGNEPGGGQKAMNAVAALAATHPRARRFVEELWNLPVPSGPYRYYDGMLYLLGMLHCAGEFRIWKPE